MRKTFDAAGHAGGVGVCQTAAFGPGVDLARGNMSALLESGVGVEGRCFPWVYVCGWLDCRMWKGRRCIGRGCFHLTKLAGRPVCPTKRFAADLSSVEGSCALFWPKRWTLLPKGSGLITQGRENPASPPATSIPLSLSRLTSRTRATVSCLLCRPTKSASTSRVPGGAAPVIVSSAALRPQGSETSIYRFLPVKETKPFTAGGREKRL